MKVRTIQILGAKNPGGAELMFTQLVAAFGRRPAQFEVLPIVRAGSWAAGRLREEGISYRTAPFGGMLDWRTASHCAAIADDFRPDVVMSWMSRPSRFMPQPHGKHHWATVARIGGAYPLKHYSGRVEHLVTITQELADRCITQGWPPEKVTVISNSRPPLEAGWEEARGPVRAKLGIPDGATVLIMAARLHAAKGYDVALEALSHLPKNVMLIALGDGALHDSLHALADRLGVGGRVRWVGWTDKVSDFAAASDIWLAPSRVEPLGSSNFDAWQHEKPLVSTDLPGPASIIKHGETGLLVPPGDAAALQAAVEKLIANPELTSRLVAQARARFERDHTEAKIVDTYFHFYRSLLAPSDVERAAS